MKGRSLLILFLITTGLLTYVYYGIQKPAEEKEANIESENRIAPGKLDQLQWVKISTPTQSFRLDRQSLGWKITFPTIDIASQAKVETLIAALEKFKKQKVLFTSDEMKTQNLDKIQYGLTPPKLTIDYKTSEMQNPYTLQIGSANPSGAGVFTETADLGLVIGSLDLDYLANQSMNDFREMRLVTVAPKDFEEISVVASGRSMKLKKDIATDTWKMIEPLQLPLDQDLTKNFVEKIGFIRANEFLNEIPSGLKKPDIRIVVGFQKDIKDMRSNESDKRPQGAEILFSKSGSAKNPVYYAKSDKTPAATIVQYHYDNFLKTPEDLVKKTFDKFLLSDIEEIKIQGIGQNPYKIVRKDENFEGDNGHGMQNLSKEAVEKLVQSLRTFKADKFISISQKPNILSALTVQIKLKDKPNFSFVFERHTKTPLLWVNDGNVILKYSYSEAALDPKTFDFNELLVKATQQKESSTEVPINGAK